MDEIKQYYPQYFGNSDDLCFKTCCNGNDDDYIVVLCKLPDTKTNESRLDIANPLYAKFRGNKFMVLQIFSIIDPGKTINEIKNSYYDKKITYKTGIEISVDDFDADLEKICSTGIHYFKSVEAVFYYANIPDNYSGIWFWYYDNGNKEEEGEYLNGKQHGKWIYYYENGNKRAEGEYLNGQPNGKWISHYINGTWISYYENGKKRVVREYLNDIETGK